MLYNDSQDYISWEEDLCDISPFLNLSTNGATDVNPREEDTYNFQNELPHLMDSDNNIYGLNMTGATGCDLAYGSCDRDYSITPLTNCTYMPPSVSPLNVMSPLPADYPFSGYEDSHPSARCEIKNQGASYTDAVSSPNQVSNWQGEECYDWARSTCRARYLNPGASLDVFRQQTGQKLLNKTEDDFVRLVGNSVELGQTLYRALPRIMYNEYEVTPSFNLDGELTALDTFFNQCNYLDTEICDSVEAFVQPDNFIKEELHPDEIKNEPLSPGSVHNKKQRRQRRKSSRPNNATRTVMESLHDDGSCHAVSKIETKSRNRVRGPKNWEFLIRLLADPQYNPSHIRWIDRENYVFRLEQQHVIAAMWGQRCGKKVSYDNFARGLRYHYKTGALRDFPEKQLVYQCGPPAIQYYEYLKREAGK